MKRWAAKPQPFVLLADQVRMAAKHAGSDPSMLAWALTQYRRRHRLSEDTLANWLELSHAQLATLGLCVRPDVRLPSFSTAVKRIAMATGCHPERLALLLGEVSSGHERSAVALHAFI